MDVKFDGDVEGPWPIRGAVSGHAEIQFDTQPGLFERTARLVAHGQHTRAAGRAEVSVEEVGAETVEISAVVHGRGRGVLRPLATVISLFAGRRLQRDFSSALRELADEIAALNREVLESAGPAANPGIGRRSPLRPLPRDHQPPRRMSAGALVTPRDRHGLLMSAEQTRPAPTT